MTKTQELQERIDSCQADLESIRKDKAKAIASSDLTRRRELRIAEADAEDELDKVKAELSREQGWEGSPERAERLAVAQRERAASEAEYAEVEAMWRERNFHLEKAAALGVGIVERHGRIGRHALSAIEALYSRPQDMSMRMDRARLILPLALGNTNLLSLAIATGLQEVMTSVPGGLTASQEYLVPNPWTRSNVSVEEAIGSIRREFTAQMGDMIPAVLQ